MGRRVFWGMLVFVALVSAFVRSKTPGSSPSAQIPASSLNSSNSGAVTDRTTQSSAAPIRAAAVTTGSTAPRAVVAGTQNQAPSKARAGSGTPGRLTEEQLKKMWEEDRDFLAGELKVSEADLKKIEDFRRETAQKVTELKVEAEIQHNPRLASIYATERVRMASDMFLKILGPQGMDQYQQFKRRQRESYN